MVVEKNQETKKVVSENLKFLLLQNGKTRKDVCQDLNIKYTTFCDWINGRIIPKYQNLEMLGEYFSIEPVDFYKPLSGEESIMAAKRVLTYAKELQPNCNKELEMSMIKDMSDEQIIELVNSGVSFKHKSYEERLAECGGVAQSYKFDWGEPKGREIL
ncbi:helix-turn-helix domain-containing protein [Pseudobutyrivibrio xylanivorans]|uniref:Helix-turn-helix transcriptional regulator n=1 Tax=Pseudobutyrivibrio xylanivorans TaxID=185007 RepID=A0A5P6VT83_PSEXY|nr:helix-turn-helix transcriptional regulator [Pseudobutyrivibrio xylanivorans]QFJ55925.1 helix-turn-helix transcriptional regulator [Pseudobutyrivibrio xylanivorans]